MLGSRRFAWLLNRVHSTRECRSVASVALALVLALQCFELRAELFFRSAEQVNGQQRWSPIRKYSNPSDTAHLRVSAGGAAGPTEEVRVFLSGPITREDVDSLGVMTNLLRSGRQKLAGNSVWFASTGGDIDAAMDLGRLLRKLGVFTLVGKNDQCLSACVFAFMGGERRIVAGQLGIHRPFFPFTHDSADRQTRFRHLQRVLRDYIDELDFPGSLYEAVMAVPPETIQMVVATDLKKFYLEGISPSSEDLADAASARRFGLSMAEYLQRKAKAPACALLVAGQGRCETEALEAAASGGAADEPVGMKRIEVVPAGRVAGRAVDPPEAGPSRRNARKASGSS